jgi:hypothetical protein
VTESKSPGIVLRRTDHRQARQDLCRRTTAKFEQRVADLQNLLLTGLPVAERASIKQLYQHPELEPLDLGLLAAPAPRPDWAVFKPGSPSFLTRILGRVEAENLRARNDYQRALDAHDRAEVHRQQVVVLKRKQYQDAVQEEMSAAVKNNSQLEILESNLEARNPVAVTEFALKILTTLPFPDGFANTPRLQFFAEHEHLAIEWELPSPAMVPEIKSIDYNQTWDQLVEIKRSLEEKRHLYRAIIAQVALLVLQATFAADSPLRQVSFHGRVHRINPGTGRPERPYLTAVSIDRSRFETLVLAKVDPQVCLAYLQARMSVDPLNFAGVEPFFSMLEAPASAEAIPQVEAVNLGPLR